MIKTTPISPFKVVITCTWENICHAVAYFHNLKPPVVHRDIKPANVLVDEATQVTKLCDLELSKLKSPLSVNHTTSTGIPGTEGHC